MTEKIVAEIRNDEGLRFFEGGVVGTLRTIDACGDKVVIELEQVGQIDGTFESTGRVYSANGLCPTINTMGGGDRQPKIVEPCIGAMRGRNPESPTSRKSGLPTEQMLEIKDDGTSNTLTTVQKDNLVVEPKLKIPCMNKNGYMEAQEGDGVVTSRQHQAFCTVSNQVSFAIRAGNASDSGVVQHFRVRKLTPKECWRLMGFTDEDFYKAKTALNKTFYNGRDKSNSQMYKQAGNSIVVDVLEAEFENMTGGNYDS